MANHQKYYVNEQRLLWLEDKKERIGNMRKINEVKRKHDEEEQRKKDIEFINMMENLINYYQL